MSQGEHHHQNPFLDDRIDPNVCAYCGSSAKTKDHVPPKVFLDEPHPVSNFTVPACVACNTGPATDEEFVAVLFDALSFGADDISAWRTKTRNAVARNPKLLRAAKMEADRARDLTTGAIDSDRVQSVLSKIAAGHWRFETGDRAYDPPDTISVQDISNRAERSQEVDEYVSSVVGQNLLPELGSRAFLRLLDSGISQQTTWRSLQEGRYEYCIGDGGLAICFSNRYLCISKWSASHGGSVIRGELLTWRSRVEPWALLPPLPPS